MRILEGKTFLCQRGMWQGVLGIYRQEGEGPADKRRGVGDGWHGGRTDRLQDGSYLVFVEEDFKAKVIVYHLDDPYRKDSQ